MKPFVVARASAFRPLHAQVTPHMVRKLRTEAS